MVGPSPGATRVYEGQVRPRGKPSAPPIFRYERWEHNAGEARVSTHVTFAPTDAVPVLVHEATHDDAFGLMGLRAWDRTRGVTGKMTMTAEGAVFERTRRGRTRTRLERNRTPLVFGPTLIGWARAHWRELASGSPLIVHFAVVEDLRSYRFELRMTEQNTTAATTTVTLRATGPLTRVMVRPMRMVFDSSTREITGYHGRVPPRRPGGGALDADVTYSHTR